MEEGGEEWRKEGGKGKGRKKGGKEGDTYEMASSRFSPQEKQCPN